MNWENTYRLPFLCTTETKLRVFQFMFLHRRIATNDFLFKIGLKQADSCSFCGEFTETLAHLFWYCSYTQKLLLLLGPFLVDSGRMFGLVYSPWERVTTSHHRSLVSLFFLLNGTVLSLVSLLFPTMLFSG